jgi:hypothetical protein
MNASRSRFLPSLTDFVIAAVLLWVILFAIGNTGFGLLQDASTGTHIRTGDYILQHREVPRVDVFSFTRPGAPWFAFEWLSDVLFSLAHQLQGLKGVILISAGVIGLLIRILLRHMLWHGANALFLVLGLNLAVGAMSIHFLARPHLFTLLFLAISLLVLDRDYRKRTALVWWLVPLSVIWINLHPGFLGLVISVGILSAGAGLEAFFNEAERTHRLGLSRRYFVLAAAGLGASAINPYGLHVHAHVLGFVGNKWVSRMVHEHQPPQLGSWDMLPFEILLAAAAVYAVTCMRRREFAWPLLMLAWGFASLSSRRQIAIFTIVCLPRLVSEASRLWSHWAERQSARSIARTLADMAAEHTPNFRRTTLWTPLFYISLWLTGLGLAWPTDFPTVTYPAGIEARHAPMLRSARMFTTDAWADYLNYWNYPNQKLFVDGRSDFYGLEIFEEYVRVLNGNDGWEQVLRKYDVTTALVPSGSPVAVLLARHAAWRLVENDGHAALFERH